MFRWSKLPHLQRVRFGRAAAATAPVLGARERFRPVPGARGGGGGGEGGGGGLGAAAGGEAYRIVECLRWSSRLRCLRGLRHHS